jgi:hypothetical protein
VNRLLIGLVTRGRPELLKITVEKTLENLREPDSLIVILADEDDQKMKDAALEFNDPRVVMDVRPREDSIGGKVNRVMAMEWEVYFHMTDYVPYTTPGFDTKVLEAASIFPDGIGVVYNHMANLSFSFANGVTRKLADKMGYVYPEYFPYWFVDHWLDDIARIIDRIAVAEVSCQYADGRKPNTQEHREPGFWGACFTALVLERREIARKIIDSADFIEPEWRKRLMRRHHTLIEERSALLNNSLKGMPANVTGTDERYARIKQMTLKRVGEWMPALEAEGLV